MPSADRSDEEPEREPTTNDHAPQLIFTELSEESQIKLCERFANIAQEQGFQRIVAEPTPDDNEHVSVRRYMEAKAKIGPPPDEFTLPERDIIAALCGRYNVRAGKSVTTRAVEQASKRIPPQLRRKKDVKDVASPTTVGDADAPEDPTKKSRPFDAILKLARWFVKVPNPEVATPDPKVIAEALEPRPPHLRPKQEIYWSWEAARGLLVVGVVGIAGAGFSAVEPWNLSVFPTMPEWISVGMVALSGSAIAILVGLKADAR